MSNDRNNHLSDSERRAMQSAPGGTPPAGLEDRTVAALKSEGLIHTRKGGLRMKVITYAAVAAAMILSFVSGVVVTKTGPAEPSGTGVMQAQQPEATTPVAATIAGANEYMLLMIQEKGDDAGATAEMTPEEEAAYAEQYAAIVDEYRQWALDRQAEGRLVSAEKLDDAVIRLTAESKSSTLPEGRVLGGYFLIRANSLEEAEQIASTHPHIRYGGEVEIRPIDHSTGVRE